MSARGRVQAQVSIFLHQFHNLDLPNKGWYGIRVRMHWHPSLRMGSPSQARQYTAHAPRPGEPMVSWRIGEDDATYYSRPYAIRHARQDVPLHEMLSFSLPSPMPHEALMIRFELLFSTFKAGPDPILEGGAAPRGSGAPVASQTLVIPPNAFHCAHSFASVTFDALHFCQLDISVHSAILALHPGNPRADAPCAAGLTVGDLVLGAGPGSVARGAAECRASREDGDHGVGDGPLPQARDGVASPPLSLSPSGACTASGDLGGKRPPHGSSGWCGGPGPGSGEEQRNDLEGGLEGGMSRAGTGGGDCLRFRDLRAEDEDEEGGGLGLLKQSAECLRGVLSSLRALHDVELKNESDSGVRWRSGSKEPGCSDMPGSASDMSGTTSSHGVSFSGRSSSVAVAGSPSVGEQARAWDGEGSGQVTGLRAGKGSRGAVEELSRVQGAQWNDFLHLHRLLWRRVMQVLREEALLCLPLQAAACVTSARMPPTADALLGLAPPPSAPPPASAPGMVESLPRADGSSSGRESAGARGSGGPGAARSLALETSSATAPPGGTSCKPQAQAQAQAQAQWRRPFPPQPLLDVLYSPYACDLPPLLTQSMLSSLDPDSASLAAQALLSRGKSLSLCPCLLQEMRSWVAQSASQCSLGHSLSAAPCTEEACWSLSLREEAGLECSPSPCSSPSEGTPSTSTSRPGIGTDEGTGAAVGTGSSRDAGIIKGEADILGPGMTRAGGDNKSLGEAVKGEACTAAASAGGESQLTPAPGPGKQGREGARGRHVAVMVHGHQGSNLDLRLWRNLWRLLDPEVDCLMSSCNESCSPSDGLALLGRRLAEETAASLRAMFGVPGQASPVRRGQLRRLSFVGYSLGALVVRSALMDPALQPYLPFLHLFVSVSGPHMGYLYGATSALFSGGLWAMKRLQGSAVLHQLSFSDAADIRDAFLFRLSKDTTWHQFRHVILLSSPQDRYVPYHSARLELPLVALTDPVQGGAYAAMTDAALRGLLDAPSLVEARPERQRKGPPSRGEGHAGSMPTSSPGDGRGMGGLPSCAGVRMESFTRCDVHFWTKEQQQKDRFRSLSLNAIIGRAAHVGFLESDAAVRLVLWSHRDKFLDAS